MKNIHECMKYEVMKNMKTWMNMKTGIVLRICMKLCYKEYEDMNCLKTMKKLWWIVWICMKTGMYEVMKNIKTWIVWRIWRHELYEEYEDGNMYEVMKNMYEYEDRNCMKNMYEVMKNMNMKDM